MSTDLTGRSEGYRGVAIRCPGCAEAMRQVALEEPDAEVDVCDACGGLWVDWMDGEVRIVATEALRVSGLPTAPSSGKGNKDDEPRPSRNEPVAVGACPRCTRQLVAERYTLTAEIKSRRVEDKTSIVPAPTGAELLRCEDCMGAFVTRPSMEVLSWLSVTDEPPPSVRAPAIKPASFQRFITVIKGVLGIQK